MNPIIFALSDEWDDEIVFKSDSRLEYANFALEPAVVVTMRSAGDVEFSVHVGVSNIPDLILALTAMVEQLTQERA